MPESQFTVDPELEREFKALAQQWRNRTAHLSLSNELANNFAYHQIMAMGLLEQHFIEVLDIGWNPSSGAQSAHTTNLVDQLYTLIRTSRNALL